MRIAPALLTILWLSGGVARAQPAISFAGEATFYGDNTEFSNPFREGETLLGAFARAFAEVRLNERVAVRAGAFGNMRYGSERSFEQVKPVLALHVGTARSRLIFGTLETAARTSAAPDRIGPHALLPPLQRETLAFERPWEAGLQWKGDSARTRHDVWLNWQRLNRAGRRERFDAGAHATLDVTRGLAVGVQGHLVHEGGQRRSAAPVSDSLAAAFGVIAAGPAAGAARVSLEAWVATSRDVPDREREALTRTGVGGLLRLALETRGWHAHALVWRADGFSTSEGDPHYHARRRDGTEFRAVRDYAEAGLARAFVLAPDATLEVAGRWHRVENDYEYSYRVRATVGIHR